MRSQLVVALLAISGLHGCAHAQPAASVPTVRAAIFGISGPLGDRELFIDQESFGRLPEAVPDEPHTAQYVELLLARPVRTDLEAAAVSCPPERLCRLTGNPLVVTVDSIAADGRDVRVLASFAYNQTVSGQVHMTVDRYALHLVRERGGWRVIAVTRPTTH
jgi:hypothetical protein